LARLASRRPPVLDALPHYVTAWSIEPTTTCRPDGPSQVALCGLPHITVTGAVRRPRSPGCRVGGTSGLVRPWSAGGLRVTAALAHTETERPALDGERLGPVRPGTAHRTHLPGRGSVRVLRGIRNQTCPFLGRGRGKGCVGPVVAGTLLGSGGHGLLCLDRRARWGRRALRVTRAH